MFSGVRALVQRVSEASVSVSGRAVSRIDHGLLVLVGVTHTDTELDADALAAKISGLRVFPDDAGRMNRSLADVDGSLLVVSQFTLYGSVRRGRRPSFTEAAAPEHAEPLVARFAQALRDLGAPVSEGAFGELMSVALVNDGPLTLMIETDGGSVIAG